MGTGGQASFSRERASRMASRVKRPGSVMERVIRGRCALSGGGRTRDARGKAMDALRAAREAKHLTPHSLRSSRAKLPSQPEEARAPRGSCCAAEDALSREGSCFAAEALSREHRRFAYRPDTHGAAPCRRLTLPRRARSAMQHAGISPELSRAGMTTERLPVESFRGLADTERLRR